jgi:hypothetical protein
MPNFSGSFVGRANAQAAMALKDAPNHELGLVAISGPQTVSDPLWNGATVSYWGMADLVSGSGSQKGYFINQHANGDTDQGTFEGTITTAGGAVTLGGTWKYSVGTGAFTGLTGGGTYSGRMTSPIEVDMQWEGSYQLGQK